MESILAVENLKFRYSPDDDDILKGISFNIQKGEWVAIVGHNGSGKSTLARILNGLLYPFQGEVRFNDNKHLSEDTVWEARKFIGMVFQNPDNQFVGTTVRDDVAFGLENIGVPRAEMIERINHSLKIVGMDSFLNHEPHHLSGGQKQRVALAGVLAMQPEIMLLDEATSMLDPRGRKEVLEVVASLNRNDNKTIISITHDLEEAIHADRIIVLRQGQIVLQGSPGEVFSNDKLLLEMSLDVPIAFKISKELVKKGIQLESPHYKQEDLVNELWTLYLKM